VAAATVPSLGVYQPELFPTSLRGRANGLITLVAVLGSSTGLILAGIIADRSSLGEAMAVLLVGPLLVGLLVLTRFPETARVELEELNPEDRAPPSSAYPLRR
jgi:MFS family permease